MKLKLILLLLMFCITMTGFAQKEADAVKNTISALFDGMRKADTALMRSAFAPGAILQSVGKNKTGEVMVETEPIDSFILSIARPHTKMYDERISFDLIKIDGELASVWTPYQFYVGDQFSHCGVDSYQLVKLAGQWKIQYLIDTRRRQGCQ